jgi:Nucleotidyl transferase AbiEii toxin, Type IV TA system
MSNKRRPPTLVELDLIRAQSIAIDAVGQLLGQIPWQLKGATGLFYWLGPGCARLPRDLDVEVQALPAEFATLLEGAIGEGVVDGITFLQVEQVQFTPGGKRPVVYRALYEALSGNTPVHRSLCEFIVAEQLRRRSFVQTKWFKSKRAQRRLPVASMERLLAEKLRRYAVHRHGGRINTRWVDLLDMLLSARFYQGAMSLTDLRLVLAEELSEFGRPWIDELPPAPAEWLDFWDAARLETGHDFGSLGEAEQRLRSFWGPILDPDTAEPLVWSPDQWRWQ